MHEPQPYLYISDLDGTLLDENGALSRRTRSGLLKILERGVPFTIASARSHFSISKIFGDMPFALPIIEFNGAFLTDYATGEHLETNAINEEIAFEVFDLVWSAGQRPFVSSYNGKENCLHYDELINPGMVWYEARRRRAGDPRLRRTSDLRATMSEDVVSLTVMDQSESKILELRDRIHERFGGALTLYAYENEYSKGTFWLTIHDRRASKHIAMQSLKQRFSAQTQVVALGDNVNDIEMLRAADRAVAVENAVPQLQALADEVIEHHASDSVIRFIEAEALKMPA